MVGVSLLKQLLVVEFPNELVVGGQAIIRIDNKDGAFQFCDRTSDNRRILAIADQNSGFSALASCLQRWYVSAQVRVVDPSTTAARSGNTSAVRRRKLSGESGMKLAALRCMSRSYMESLVIPYRRCNVAQFAIVRFTYMRFRISVRKHTVESPAAPKIMHITMIW